MKKLTEETRRARIEYARTIVQTFVAAPLVVGTLLARLQLGALVKKPAPGGAR